MTARVSLFNNSLLSDITIRQIYKGVAKEYFAHKAVLCASSGWFVKAFTGKFKEASAATIEVHDDDPIHFEVLLRFLYDHKWDQATASKKDYNYLGNVGADLKKCHTAVAVYGLADKYDVDGLGALAVEQVLITSTHVFSGGYNHSGMVHVNQLIDAHYDNCVIKECPMGRKLCLLINKQSVSPVMSKDFVILVKKHPAFAVDIFLVAHDNDGQLW